MEQIQKHNDILFRHISHLIEESRKRIKTTIDTTMVYTYYSIGCYLIEDELNGKYRASYGKEVLQRLSKRLTDKYGEGWSYSNLRRFKQFYLTFSDLRNSVAQNQDKTARSTIATNNSQMI